jgi:hypothetical protein
MKSRRQIFDRINAAYHSFMLFFYALLTRDEIFILIKNRFKGLVTLDGLLDYVNL